MDAKLLAAQLRGSTVRPVWPEAEILREPVKNPGDPIVLVRRRDSDLVGPNGEEVIALDGFPAISLFTGAGGFDIGIEHAGYATVCQHEWNECACLTLMGNRPNYFRNAALIQGDIRSTPTSMILREAGLLVGECRLIVGGPPCQGFSTSNNRAVRGLFDARNDLVHEYLRVVREAQPHFFCFENVPGFARFNKGEYLKAFLKEAHQSYYELVYGLIDACDHGVPQRRVRFICMGSRRELVQNENRLAGLPVPEFFAKADLNKIKTLPPCQHGWITRAPGVRYFPDRPVLCPPAPNNGEDGRAKTYLEFYERLAREEPDRLVEHAPRTPQHASSP